MKKQDKNAKNVEQVKDVKVENVIVKTTKSQVSKELKEFSNYKEDVLDLNRRHKATSKTLGGIRSIMLATAKSDVMRAEYYVILKASKEKANYEILCKYVKANVKTGNFSYFAVLQQLRKNFFQIHAEMQVSKEDADKWAKELE